MVLRLLAAPTPTATAVPPVPSVRETVRLSPVAWVLSCRSSLASMAREPSFKVPESARRRLAIFAFTASSMVFVLTASPKAPPAAMA